MKFDSPPHGKMLQPSSGLLPGSLYGMTVMHRRLVAPLYSFIYRLFYLLVDIDALPALSQKLKFFSHNQFNLLSFHDSDHGPLSKTPGALCLWVEKLLASHGIKLNGGRVRLLALPRVLGFVFNPISLYYCEHSNGNLLAVIVEVRNTFGEKHCYVLSRQGKEMSWGETYDKDKSFHVSPFFNMEGRYHFQISEPGEKLTVDIKESRDGNPLFDARMTGSRVALTDRAILVQLACLPFSTLKVVFAIHWEALKIWLRGAAYIPKPPPSKSESS